MSKPVGLRAGIVREDKEKTGRERRREQSDQDRKSKDVKPERCAWQNSTALNPIRRVGAFPPSRTKLTPTTSASLTKAPPTMPPPVGRYGPSGLAAPYTLQQAHLQSQHPHAQSANTALPPPSLGGHPGFAGNPNTNINPFLSAAGVTNGMSVAGFASAGADGGGTGLASHAAQMGFARGAQIQQQQLHQGPDGRLALDSKTGAVKTRIRDVWKHNLAHELAVLRSLVDKYPYISMVSGRV